MAFFFSKTKTSFSPLVRYANGELLRHGVMKVALLVRLFCAFYFQSLQPSLFGKDCTFGHSKFPNKKMIEFYLIFCCSRKEQLVNVTVQF